MAKNPHHALVEDVVALFSKPKEPKNTEVAKLRSELSFYLIQQLKYFLRGGWNFFSSYISILSLQSPNQLN